jgi:hypothetical protein
VAILGLLPVILSALLLAAHFFRAGNLAGLAVSIGGLALLFVPRAWAARAVQVGLVVGAAEWVRTLFVFAAQRRAMSEPWGRLAVILGAVALLTLASATVFYTERLRRRYGLTRRGAA